ncbi:MAG: hypothetical protein JETT_2571 [Candidatus Jettenia ecosi]|uniref:Uncharacterized protein n=1 Tax=Candidatus Jettenia ecosi TaxID=2494326 RepID=A0A533Q939_9BACT|nr:MAG: hypothetical protein JETT_2571 [Candidatus Jettenia ecosi]
MKKEHQIKSQHYLKHIDKFHEVLQEPRLYDFLAHRYSHYEILERCGKIYPVAILDKTIRKITYRDPIVMAPEKWSLETGGFIIRDSAYRAFREFTGDSIIPNETYRMVNIKQTEHGVIIRCDIGRYDLMLDTCDCLEWEILKVLSETSYWQAMSFEALFKRLELRKYLHAHVKNPLINGTGRSVAIAVSVLTSFFNKEDQSFLLGCKSIKGLNAGQMHVIPSFMFQPEQGYRNEEFCLLHNVRREFLEELFGVKAPKGASYRWFFQHKPIQYLDKMLEAGEAEIWLTGVVVNLMNLRPEICMLLRIKTLQWYAIHSSVHTRPGERIQINEEFATIHECRGSRKESVSRKFDSDAELFHSASLNPGDIVPPGAAAFWLGVEALRKLP